MECTPTPHAAPTSGGTAVAIPPSDDRRFPDQRQAASVDLPRCDDEELRVVTVTVYYFRKFSMETGASERARRPATMEAIRAFGGDPIMASAQQVDSVQLDGNGFLRLETVQSVRYFLLRDGPGEDRLANEGIMRADVLRALLRARSLGPPEKDLPTMQPPSIVDRLDLKSFADPQFVAIKIDDVAEAARAGVIAGRYYLVYGLHPSDLWMALGPRV
jgi:hypothetical protein